jgi:hypothetical protein
MAMKEQQRMVYRSMQGKEVDMNKIINANEMTVAVGNVKVNARGDELGPGGQIIRKREEVLAASGSNIPDQINVRATKDVEDQDPEGNE